MNALRKILEIVVMITVMFFVPVMWMSFETEKLTDTYMDEVVEKFVDTVSTNGYIDSDGYERFCTELAAAGCLADVDIKCSMYVTEPEYVSGAFTGNTVSYMSEMNNEELLRMMTEKGAALFNIGDRISVTVTRQGGFSPGLVKRKNGTTFTSSRVVNGVYLDKYTEYLAAYLP